MNDSGPVVVIIGGGATGAGVLRDLSMRGVKAVLLERGSLASGASSRFHGLLHSGGRYAVGDPQAAAECLEENRLLRRIARPCVEETEGFFVLTPEDDPAYVRPWLEGCAGAGIEAAPLSPQEAHRLEPRLSPDIREVYRVPDAGVDGSRLVWHNIMSARRYGGEARTLHPVTGIEHRGGRVTGVKTRDLRSGREYVLPCDFVINAAGPWAGEVAALAGLEVKITPDRGALVVFNHRFTSRVVNRLHRSADGDIFVPAGTVTILGTTSSTARHPDDTAPTAADALRLLNLGEALFPDIWDYRILRVFAGNRPLYAPGKAGRAASRDFALVDHEEEGLAGLAGIFGGKLTTYRLMAERASDLACARLGVRTPCRTSLEPLTPDPDPSLIYKASRVFPAAGVKLAAERLGDGFPALAARLERGDGAEILCECEMVSRAEAETAARDADIRTLNDLRARTRLGMGTCQGAFCSLRALGALEALPETPEDAPDPLENLGAFFQERWRGVRPALWGMQAREIELSRAVYAVALNLDGADDERM